MVGGMTRHLQSIARLRSSRDETWINTLLAEAENERVHLMTFLHERQQNSLFFRAMVLGAQGVFWNAYFIAYLISPRFCHAFVGHLEEEAVKTYTKAIHAVESGDIPEWVNKPAVAFAREYWHLPASTTFLDVLRNVRADEAVHCRVNHTLSRTPPDAVLSPH
jgi:ubiquinol oxidase